MINDLSRRMQVAIVVAVYGAYILSFPFLFPIIGMAIGAFSFVPIALVGVFFGQRAGILAGLGVVPLEWLTYAQQLDTGFMNLTSPVTLFVVLSAMVIGGLAGRLSDLTTSLEDHRAALTESNRRFEIAAQTTGDIVWDMDLASGKTWTNQALSRFVRNTSEPCADSESMFFSALHPEDRQRVKENIRTAVESDAPRINDKLRIRRHDGEYREMEVNGIIVRDPAGRALRVVGATRDVTDRNAAERARHAELKHRMEMDRAREMDKFKTELLNTASHELNTPISALKLQLHILRAYLKRGDVDAVEGGFALLERNTDRLSELIVDTLDVARLQSGKMSLMPVDVDLRAILDDVVATYAPVADQDGLRLVASVPDELRVHVDPQRMAQVLTNLVGNAIKFTPRDGTVTISAHSDGDGVVVDVQDTGLGMTKDQVGRLFQAFVRVHDVNVVKKGTGLGLYISKGIVEQSGGRIWCDSAGPNAGSTFHVRIPAVA